MITNNDLSVLRDGLISIWETLREPQLHMLFNPHLWKSKAEEICQHLEQLNAIYEKSKDRLDVAAVQCGTPQPSNGMATHVDLVLSIAQSLEIVIPKSDFLQGIVINDEPRLQAMERILRIQVTHVQNLINRNPMTVHYLRREIAAAISEFSPSPTTALTVSLDQIQIITHACGRTVKKKTVHNRGNLPCPVSKSENTHLYEYEELRAWWPNQKFRLKQLPPADQAEKILKDSRKDSRAS